MGRVVEPLRAMGARIAGRAGATLLPLAITGRARLVPIAHRTPVPSAQVKSAILLAGLAADGETRVTEAVATRDHTERMLRARGVAVREFIADDGAHVVAVPGPAAPAPADESVPSDPSGAAFWLVAGAIHPDAELRLTGVSTNPTRRAIIDILRRMGASIEELAQPVPGGPDGEPLADLVVRSSELRGIDLAPADVAAAIDEIPVLALAAAMASGTTRIRGASELRHKESDRIAGIAAGLVSLGADVRVEGDDIEIRGGRRLRGAPVETLDDHRLAMTFAVAGLIAEGETVIDRPGSAAISYPGFFRDLEGVRA
jgi:3-phosphoshikimate 1-carboxyvinyltransferase